MTNSTKLALFAATLSPFLLIFACIAIIFLAGGNFFSYFFTAAILNMLISLALTVFYIVHVMKSEDLKSEMKAVWAIVVLFAGPIGMAIYWYLNIWNEPPASTRPTLGPPDTASWVRPEDRQQQRQGEYVPPSEMPDWR